MDSIRVGTTGSNLGVIRLKTEAARTPERVSGPFHFVSVRVRGSLGLIQFPRWLQPLVERQTVMA